MRKNVLLFGPVLLCLLCCLRLSAQNASDIVVPVTVTTSASPLGITLSFPATANAVSTLIGKKLINQTSWNFAVLPAAATAVTDTGIVAGVGYEYIVIKQTSTAPTTRYGLVYAGVQVGATVYRGKMILVVDNTLSTPLASELDRFVQDLRGDGWQVLRHDIAVASSTIQSVKAVIENDYNADPNNTITALLFGNIPVPYSGEINPDGKTDHVGAWPTDYYYGDLDAGIWTDNTVNNTTAARAANRNVPGDGKFDQSQTPTPPELIVSRVDFSNLTGWPESQTELYRRYLNKNHAFRTGAYRPDNKTIVDDNFGFASGEAFAQNGFANGYALTGSGSVQSGDFFGSTKTQSYLVGYGAGEGDYSGATGVGTSDNFKTDSVNVVFSMLFRGYFGDWDYETNPFMPSALASKGGILTCSWAGRPNWFFHQMGLGEPILTSVYWTWINSFLANPVYPPNFGSDLVHVGLLGDPTLRAHAVKPPTNVTAVANCDNVTLSWTASADQPPAYVIYRAPSQDSIFDVIGFSAAGGFIDTLPLSGANFYQVKALTLQTTPTGSYFNQSLGIPATATFSPTPPVVSATAARVSCHGAADGAVTLNVSGGMNFTYLWSNGMNTANISGLGAGTYTVTVTNPQLCTATASATVTEPPALTLNPESGNINCFGANDGSIDLTADGGAPPYLFNWSNGSMVQNLKNLSPGAYTVTMTDANGCTAGAMITLTQPSDITLELDATDASCNGAANGGINANIQGGTPGYTFHWSNNASTAFLANVAAGSYSLTATDNNGCSKTANATIAQPPAIEVSSAVTNAGCAGATNGGIALTVGNGVPDYTFLWSDGSTNQDLTNVQAATYTVTVTDASGCTQTSSATVQQITTLKLEVSGIPTLCFGSADGSAVAIADGGTPDYTYLWSNGATDIAVNGLLAGTYTATVTDDAGCSQTATVVVVQPSQLALVLSPADALCNGSADGAINLVVSGGTPSFTYNWSNSQTGKDVSGLGVGSYTVTVTDTNGCTETGSASIAQPEALGTVVTFTQTGCNGAVPLLGDVLSETTGGTLPYKYAWSNGAVTKNLIEVPSGNYTVTITDLNGCTVTNTTTTFQFAQPWAVSTQVTNVVCNGGNTGKVSLTVSGSFGSPYAFKWSNNATTKDLTNVLAGTYTVTVTDIKGCTTSTSAIVAQPGAIVLQFNTIAPVSCPGLCDGKATLITYYNGVPPVMGNFNFSWSDGSTDSVRTDLCAGKSKVTVTDDNGCVRTDSLNITSPVLPAAVIQGVDSACVGSTYSYQLPGPNFSGFQWVPSANGTIMAGQGTNSVVVIWNSPGAGVMNVYFASLNGCPDTAVFNLTAHICIGTEEAALPGVRVMPNPFGDWLTVQFDRPVQPGARLRLTDMQGRLIADQPELTEKTRLETPGLPAGAYLLHLTENGRSGVWKLVKAD